MSLALICHRCPKRGPLVGAAMPCGIDGRDIIDHAKGAYCPAGKFAGIVIPVVELSGFDPAEERRRLKQGGCCGTPSEGN